VTIEAMAVSNPYPRPPAGMLIVPILELGMRWKLMNLEGAREYAEESTMSSGSLLLE